MPGCDRSMPDTPPSGGVSGQLAQQALEPSKLAPAAAMPTMRNAAGDGKVSAMPRVRSRGLKPLWHPSQ